MDNTLMRNKKNFYYRLKTYRHIMNRNYCQSNKQKKNITKTVKINPKYPPNINIYKKTKEE